MRCVGTLAIAVAVLMGGCQKKAQGPQTTVVPEPARPLEDLKPAEDTPTVTLGAADGGLDTAKTVDPNMVTIPPPPPPPPPLPPVVHVVQAKETLWSIAERYLGSGKRWPEIVAANPGLDPDPKRLPVGTRLTLPEK